MSGALPIGPWELAGAAALVLINGALSFWLKLGLERRLAIASLRTLVQLSLLGYILLPIFRYAHPALVLGLGLVMSAIAAREALRRTSRSYRGAWLGTFGALVLSAGGTAVFGSAVLIGVEPWWTPRYFIPLLGMILGNGLTGISLGLESALREIDDGRARIEALLAVGATWWEAARPVAAQAIRTALIPITNTMSVVGLVSIPGMMTGQLLGGTTPEQAARYQILILFLIAASTALGSASSILLAVRKLFDSQHRVRPERLTRKGD